MNNDDFKKIRGLIHEELEPVKKTLDKHTQILDKHTQILSDHTKILTKHSEILDKHSKKLDTLWEQTAKLTVDLTEVQETLDHHTASLKRIEKGMRANTDNIIRLDKRATTVEDRFGIVPPTEFSVIK